MILGIIIGVIFLSFIILSLKFLSCGDGDLIPGLAAICVGLSLIISLLFFFIDVDEKDRKDSNDQLQNVVKMEIEKAYYEGQRDYAEGRIRIRDERYDHCYHWIESPWDGGILDSVVYKPECTVKKEE